MKTITTNLYKFSELSKEVQETLLEKNRYYETEFNDWYDPITEGFTEDMAEAGFAKIETQFSGFYSQGDGACFTGRVTDLRLFMENFLDLPQEVKDFDGAMEIAIIKRGETFASRYCHSNTIEANIEVYDIQMPDCIRAFENTITKWARTQSDKYYKDLEQYYDEITSDESVTEILEEKGEVFLKDGSYYSA
jgi:hypothetical protein